MLPLILIILPLNGTPDVSPLSSIDDSQLSSYRQSLIARTVDGDRSSLSYMSFDVKESLDDYQYQYLSDAFWIYQHDFFDSPGIFG